MNYGKIVEDSFSIAWRHKSLWIFGLFAGMGGDYNLRFEQDAELDYANLDFESIDSLVAFIAPIMMVLIILILLFFVLHLICSPALVDAVNKIARGGAYKFSESYSRGIDFFWRYLGLNLLFAVAIMGAALVSAGMLIILGVFAIFIIIPFLLIAVFSGATVFALAERAMVVRNSNVADSIEEGWLLFRNNLGKCVVVLLILIGLGLGSAIVLGLLGLILYFPVNVLVEALSSNQSIILVLAIILGLPVSLVLGGFVGTFFHNLYTLFYFGLVDSTGPYASKGHVSAQPVQ